MSDVNEIFADVEKEGENPFDALVTPAESQPETVNEEVTPEVGEEGGDAPEETPEDNIPFHKHPRWIQLQKELKEKDEMLEQVMQSSQKVQELDEKLSKYDVVSSDIPDWFVELYGDNEKAWVKYQQHEQERKEEIKRELYEEQQRAFEREKLETEKTNRWVEENIASLEAEGKNFERNELLKVMLEYRPTDVQGNLDFQAGYKILEATKGTKEVVNTQARKQVADTATKTSTAVKPKKDYLTPNDLRNVSWNQL